MASIGGLDSLADAYNLMGAQGLTNPNPYLQFTGQIPMAGYSGTPTDAAGNPIQSFTDAQAQHDAWKPPGTTLNSSPAVAQAATYGLQPSDLGGPSALNPTGNEAFGMQQWGGMMSPQAQELYRNQQFASPGQAQGSAPMSNQAFAGSQAQGGGPQNPVDMRQAYLTALSNPGKVNTPGAQILPGTSMTGPVGTGQPSVLQAFLQAHPQGGTSVPGGYSNKSFFNTLNQLQAGKS